MPKYYWYEVYTFAGQSVGTKTIDSFDTLSEAQTYVSEHSAEELFIDEWEMNEDGTGLTYRNLI